MFRYLWAGCDYICNTLLGHWWVHFKVGCVTWFALWALLCIGWGLDWFLRPVLSLTRVLADVRHRWCPRRGERKDSDTVDPACLERLVGRSAAKQRLIQ